MPSGTYYRRQAELFGRLAVASRDPQVAERYHRLAAEQLDKADKARAGMGNVARGEPGADDPKT